MFTTLTTELEIIMKISRNMLHASGKFVPSIISFISSGINEEQKEVLTSYQVSSILCTKCFTLICYIEDPHRDY